MIGFRPGKFEHVENLDTVPDQESGQDYINADWGRGGEHVWVVMELFRRGEVGMEDGAARREDHSFHRDVLLPLLYCQTD